MIGYLIDALALRSNAFAWFMDTCVRPIVWLASPKLREHDRYVKVQNAHLRDNIHPGYNDPDCWYCKAFQEDRRKREESA